MKQKGLILFIILCLVLTMPAVGFAADEEEPAKIADVAFKDVLRGMLHKGVYEDVYPSELEQFTGHMDLSDMGITDLRGLEYFVNVTSFDLSYNEIDTLPTKINLMDNLESLNLSFNDMYELPSNIADAPSLVSLNVSGNKLSNLPVRIQEMVNLKDLDISANRFEILPHRLVYLDLNSFNCNYNFFDFSEGSTNKKDLDAMNVSGEKLVSDQLAKLPAITYMTDNGDFKVKWRALDDMTFADGTRATVSGYSILMDGEFIKTVDPEETEYSFGWMEAGSYKLSVSPDYIVDGYGDFPIRFYTDYEGAVFGKDGPYLPENDEAETVEAATTEAVVTETNEENTEEAVSDAPQPAAPMVEEEDGLSILTLILIGAVVLLAAGLITMIVVFLKKDKK